MSTSELKKSISNALQSLPKPDLIRSRLAENLKERQLLRQLLKLAETEPTASAVKNGEGVDA